MSGPISPSDRLTGDRLRDQLAYRQDTADLIRADGMDVQLHRKVKPTPDGAGGYVDASPTRYRPQEITRRWFKRSLYEPAGPTGSATGFGTHEKFVLIGLHTDDIQPEDIFFVGGLKYVVQFVHADMTYQVKAEGEAVSGDG